MPISAKAVQELSDSTDRKPEGTLHGKDGLARNGERAEQVAKTGSRCNHVPALVILLPDDEERAARPPLPTQDDVAA